MGRRVDNRIEESWVVPIAAKSDPYKAAVAYAAAMGLAYAGHRDPTLKDLRGTTHASLRKLSYPDIDAEGVCTVPVKLRGRMRLVIVDVIRTRREAIP